VQLSGCTHIHTCCAVGTCQVVLCACWVRVELKTQEILAAQVLVVGSSSVRHDSLNGDEVVVLQNEKEDFDPKIQPLSQSPPTTTFPLAILIPFEITRQRTRVGDKSRRRVV
jgi:hypothetical protein